MSEPIYLGQGDVKVFPSTRRTYNSAHSRQVTEANLVNMINKLIDKDGFVYTKLVGNENPINTDFIFNIHGYYFSVNLSTLTNGFSNNIYAQIEIDPGATSEFDELKYGDVDNSYKGISFIDTQPASTANKYSLHILTKNSNDNWIVPESSQMKFDKSSFNLDLIDGGVI